MNVCQSHGYCVCIIYEKGGCPLCEMEEQKNILQSEIDLLKAESSETIDQFNGEIISLKDDIKQLNQDIYKMQLEVF